MTVLLVLLTLVVFLAVDGLVQHLRAKKVGAVVRERVSSLVESLRQLPGNIELARNHTWIRPEQGNVVTVGLDEFVARFLGAVERIVLPDAGSDALQFLVKDGDRAIAIACPVPGRVVAVNSEILRNPAAASADPYGAGWLVRVQMPTPASARGAVLPGSTMGAPQAAEWLRGQMQSAREFFQGRSGGEQYALMQDGGEMVDGVLKLYGADVWTEFGDRYLTTPSVPADGETK